VRVRQTAAQTGQLTDHAVGVRELAHQALVQFDGWRQWRRKETGISTFRPNDVSPLRCRESIEVH